MYPALNENCAAMAKVEAVAGIAESLSTTVDGVQLLGVSEPQIFFHAPNTLDEIVTGSLDTDAAPPPTGRCARFRVRFIAQAADAAYAFTSEAVKVVPESHAFLCAAGYGLTVGGGAATYALAADPATTITFQCEVSGKKYLIQGSVMEALQLLLQVGQYGIFEGTIVGVMITDPSELALEAVTYAKKAKALFVGTASFTVGAFTPKVDNVTINWNLTAQPNTNANASDGIDFFKVVARKVELSFGARIPSIATWDPMGDWKARTVRAIAIIHGVNQGSLKRLKINASNPTYEDVQDVPNGKFRSISAKMKLGAHASAVCNLVWD